MGVEVPRRKSLITPLITTAAVLGTIQGFFWVLLSLGAILCYEGVFSPPHGSLDDKVDLKRIIYDAYLRKGNDDTDNVNKVVVAIDENVSRIVTPKEFNYIMFVYLVLSFSLLIISLFQLWASITGKSEKFHKLRILIWTINMALLSMLDFIILCLIGHDYGQIKFANPDFSIIFHIPLNLTVPPSIALTIFLTAVGVVMTLAARGFVVWIINVIFIVILGKHWYDLHTKKTYNEPDPSILDAYTTSSRPPWDLTNSIYADTNRSGYNNKAFNDDNDNPKFISSSQSFTHLPLHDRDNYGNREGRGNQKNQYPYAGNPGNQNNNMNNNNNWSNKRNQNDNGPYGLGQNNNSPLRPFSQPERTSDVPNQWNQGAPLRTAKIGRQGGQRSPPLNVNPPFIPDPDYSPPGSPRVRGVLRPKSNYAMY